MRDPSNYRSRHRQRVRLNLAKRMSNCYVHIILKCIDAFGPEDENWQAFSLFQLIIRAWRRMCCSPRIYCCRRRWSLASCALTIICITIIVILTIVYCLSPVCISPAADRKKLAFMVKAFDEIMTELNIIHWIDYGTLLGALRYQDIILWDHDGDVSFDRKFANLLHNGGRAQQIAKERYGIHLNAAVMVYENMQVDVYSWNKTRTSNGDFIYKKAANRNADIWESQFNDFNASFIDKTVLIPFAGGMVKAPYPPMEFIKKRFPTSYNRTIPWKFTCYAPWNLPYWLF